MNDLSIVIPFYNGYEYIGELINDLRRYNFPIIIIDDHSDKKLKTEYLGGNLPKNLKIVRPEKKGYFAGAVNAGIKECAGDVLVLNQDARLQGDAWLNILAEKGVQYGLIGERIKGNHPAHQNGYVQGTFMFMARSAIKKVGLLDADNFPLWGGTCDWQLKIARKGFRILPLETVPGFTHDRPGRFGSSIEDLLKKEPKLKDKMIRTPPLVSVIVPCYNYGKYLPDLVGSMVGGKTSLGDMPGQTFSAFELIIVDDGSTDNTPEIIKSLVDPWKCIRSVRKEKRSGTPSANNTGVRASFGRAVTILGADDMMEVSRLKVMYEAWEEDQTRVVYDDNYMFKDGRRFQKFELPDYDFEKLLNRNHVHCGILFARKAFNEVDGYPEEMTLGREDWAMNVRLGINGYCGYHIHQPLYLYRREGENRTLRNTNQEMKAYFRAQMEALFPKIYKGERPMACCGGHRGGSRKVKSLAPSSPLSSPARVSVNDDLVLIEYIGANYGSMTFYGVSTGQHYKFGKNHPLGYVAKSDLATGSMRKPGFLDIQENGKSIFRLAKVERANPAEFVPLGDQRAAAGDENIPQPGDIYHPEKMTLAEIKKLVSEGMTQDALAAFISLERAGKNRKSVLVALGAAL